MFAEPRPRTILPHHRAIATVAELRAAESPIPVLSDLRESGSIEQDADSVLMLYRQEMYDPDCEQPGVTDLYLRKNRNGPTGVTELRFDGRRMSFAGSPGLPRDSASAFR